MKTPTEHRRSMFQVDYDKIALNLQNRGWNKPSENYWRFFKGNRYFFFDWHTREFCFGVSKKSD